MSSIDATVAAWSLDVPAGQKLIALAIADSPPENPYDREALLALGERCGTTPEQTKRALDGLNASGGLWIVYGEWTMLHPERFDWLVQP